MKKIILTLLLMTSPLVFAEQTANETLLSGAITHGGFGGPEFKLSQVNGETNYLTGGKGAWLVNKQYYLGGGGYALMKRMDKNGRLYEFGYGGLIVGCIGAPTKLWHYSADVLMGGGGVSEFNNAATQVSGDRGDTVFVLEPRIYGTLNLTPFAELNLGAGYRWVREVDRTVFGSNDLNGWVITANVMFGHF